MANPANMRPFLWPALGKLLLTLSLLFCPAALLSEPGNPYDTERPEFAALAELEERAANLTLGAEQDASARRRTIEAWQALEAAAAREILSDGQPHPLVHASKVKIASQLYALGENGAARERLEAGIDSLRPYQAYYPGTWAEGLALLGVLMTQDGDGEAAWPVVVEGYRSFLETSGTGARSDEDDGLAMSRSNLEFALAEIAARTGRSEEAVAFQKTSLETREAALGPNHPDTIASYYGYAGALRRAGRMEEAERTARLAVERAVEHMDSSHPSYARALEMLGIVLSRSGRPIEATDYLVRALELKREHEGSDNLVFGYGIHNLATILLQRERYADASPLFVEAEALFRQKQGEDSPYAIGSLAYAAQIDFAEGRAGEAVGKFSALEKRLGDQSSDLDMQRRIAPDFIRALLATGDTRASSVAQDFQASVLRTEQPDPILLRLAHTLAARTAADGDAKPAGSAITEARGLVELLERRGTAEMRGNVPAEERSALDLAMEIAARQNDAPLMLSAMALLTSSALSQATVHRADRMREDDPAFAEALRALQDADAAVETADGMLLQALANGERTLEMRTALESASARREAALSLLKSDFPAWSMTSEGMGAPNLRDLRNGLQPGETLLAVVPAYSGLYILLVDRQGALATKAGAGRAQVVALARSLRDDIVTGRDDEEKSRELAAAILTPSVRARLSGQTSLRILAGGALASFPFAVLDWAENEPGVSRRLIDRFALSHVSGFNLFPASADKDRKLARFVGFADPAPFGGAEPEILRSQPMRGISGFFDRSGPDETALARLPRLDASRKEALDVARLFSSGSASVLVGQEASEGALSDPGIRQADVVLFATHGLVAGEIEGIAEPALVLAAPQQPASEDGLLTASEIADLKFNADWVILSACDSAAGMGGGLPAFSGLAQAFRYAGANSLLVTHWRVRDDIAAFVSRETLRRWQEHGDKAKAFQEAIVALRDKSGIPDADRPAFWAPFVLIQG
ncbi:tetratricopeptide repeat protein [Qipengyuania sp. MTN3-11]